MALVFYNKGMLEKQTMERTQQFSEFSISKQSCPQSLRYPCPAERENELLWEKAVEQSFNSEVYKFKC